MTHPDVTRFFMTIEEAVGLVLEAAHLAVGGETYVLDMGEPVRIVDLVSNYARQLELPDVEIRFTGLRPGEKLHESLFSTTEQPLPTAHSRIFSTLSCPVAPDFGAGLQRLFEASSLNATDEVKNALGALLGTYAQAATGPALAIAAPYPDDY